MFGRNDKPSIDVNRMVGAAMNAFMTSGSQIENGRVRNHREDDGGPWGSIGAVAVGAALAVTARAVYSRARRSLDLERVADAVEQRLSD